MEIISSKHRLNYLPTQQHSHLNDLSLKDPQGNFDTQAMQGSLDASFDTMKSDESAQVNATTFAIQKSFKQVESAVNGASDPIRSKMKAAKRDLNQIEDLVNSLKTKQRKAEVIEDARAHIGTLNGFIKNIHMGYQKTYGDIIKEAIKYMQDINTAIGKMGHRMDAGKDGKIKFFPEDFAKDINEVVAKYSNKEYSGSDPSRFFGDWNLTSDTDISNAKPLIQITKAEGVFEFWNKKLSGLGFVIKETQNHINIHPDYKPIKEIFSIIAKTNASWKGSDIMAQEFQSLQTAIDSQKNAINSSNSRLLETFRQDNSHFDTLVQLLIQLIKDLNQYNNGLMNI